MRLDMDHIIFFYIFICIALLVFNIGYILRSQGRSRGMERSIRRWQAEMHAQWASGSITPVHREHLTRRLKKIRPLLAYHTALRPELEHPSAPVHRYLEEVRPVFQELALSYQKRPAMERAFFAYVIAEFFPAGRPSQDRLAELLLGFLDDSTVYCRENVLLALCSLGNAGALERALERFHRQNWYHHPRLLSDGLATFSGNQTSLARRLWKAAASWNENLQVAVVQFAAGLPLGGGQELSDSLLAALSQKKLSLETGFAILRYFQRHPHPEAKPVLLDLAMRNTDEGGTGHCRLLRPLPVSGSRHHPGSQIGPPQPELVCPPECGGFLSFAGTLGGGPAGIIPGPGSVRSGDAFLYASPQ